MAAGLRDHRPYYRAGEAPKTSINLSEAKDAKQIAADIRRFTGSGGQDCRAVGGAVTAGITLNHGREHESES
jgi:hypothetical protein